MTQRRPVRIGAVSYLNTRPLVHGLREGLGRGRIDLSYDVPSALARRLAAGDLDVALVPSIELARLEGLTVVPGLGIAARHEVLSVLLVSRAPVAEMTSIALDPESRTSNALVRVLCAGLWGVAPRFEEAAGPLDAILASHDAAIRIGDKALHEPLPEGGIAHDLAGAWRGWTGLPFVFAVWAARPGALDAETVGWLHESYRRGRAAIDEIAAEHAAVVGGDRALLRRYLTEHVRFEVGDEELRGLHRFLELAARHGAVDRVPEVRLAAPPDRDGREPALSAGGERIG
jgi:chorismate dehydratase